jgi:primosomal protein N'
VCSSDLLGPTPALVEEIRRMHRMQILVKIGADSPPVRELVYAARESLADTKGTELQWDVDPMSLS